MIFRPRPLTDEFKLLAGCCGWTFADRNLQSIQRLASGVDWLRFVHLSQRHRVQGLAWNCLRNIKAEMPVAIADILSEQAAAIVQHNLRSASQSQRLLHSFAGANIPLIFIKGLTLSKLAYDDPFLKMGWDIDILIPPDAVNASAAELKRLGFHLIVPAASPRPDVISQWHRRRKESVWRSADGLHVELHTRLADSLDLIPAVGIGSPRQQVQIAADISLPTLGLDDLFAYLCVHGASSAWFRLKWATDLAALLRSCTAPQIEQLYQHARRLGAGRAADQALILVSRLYGTLEGSDLLRQLERSIVSRRLADAAWNEMIREDEPTAVRFGTLPIHLTQLFLQPGVKFKIREATRQVADWVSPLR